MTDKTPLEALADELTTVVKMIEAKPATTRHHYGDYPDADAAA